MSPADIAALPHETILKIESIAKRIPNITPEEEAFLEQFQPDQVNPCGECTLCCVAPTIERKHVSAPLTAPKPAGEACEHCDVRGGCRVYDSRPSICRGYMCLYALGISPDRPDSTGVCWTFQPVENLPDDSPALFVATGHTLDYDEAMKDRRNVMAIYVLLGMGASGVIFRSPTKVVQFATPNDRPVFDGPILLRREVPIDPADPLKHDWLPHLEKIEMFTP